VARRCRVDRGGTHRRVPGERPLIVVDTYPGTDLAGLIEAMGAALPGFRAIDVEAAAAKPIADIDAIIARNLTDDRVFGVLSHHELPEFYEEAKLAALRAEVAASDAPTVLVGWGSALVPVTDAVLVLADMARWEIQ
jgi:hypothetical protein